MLNQNYTIENLCVKESWAKSSSRQRTLLLDLIRRIGVDFSSLTEKELTIRSLSLLWDLFHDERLPVEMVDAALEAHFNILESAVPAEELRRLYIERCIDELLLDSGDSVAKSWGLQKRESYKLLYLKNDLVAVGLCSLSFDLNK
ncbi:unnamed protein product [Onchocerca flexuosa]|uniref:NR LBD domain-containing protein n=1 Tax=Onchocerca flexuosa TaxID=387005 RepID=A0A183HTM1_9BILA|nr:unnamed protein product [Onchocerca flexuosa]